MSDKLLEVEGESKNCYFVSPQIEAMVQTLEYVDSLRGRDQVPQTATEADCHCYGSKEIGTGERFTACLRG